MQTRNRDYSLVHTPKQRVSRSKDVISRIAELLRMNKALESTDEALVIHRTPRKKNKPILNKFHQLSPSKVTYKNNHYFTTTPRQRILHRRTKTTTPRGEFELLVPSEETPSKVNFFVGKPEKVEMPIHDSSIIRQMDIHIDYQTLQKHRENLSALPTHRQKPEPKTIFGGSAHGKLNGLEPEETLPMLHWCHILAQSLRHGTQFPENFLIGTPQANAGMLLFEGLIPEMLAKLHKKSADNSNPEFFLDLEWSYFGDPNLRIGDQLKYRIKNEPGDHPLHFLEKTFDMRSPTKTPYESISFTWSLFEEEFSAPSIPRKLFPS